MPGMDHLHVALTCGVLTHEVVGYGDIRDPSLTWTGGIKNWGWGGEGWTGYYAIRSNVVRDCGPVDWAPGKTKSHGIGIWADEVLRPHVRPEIYGNVVSNCYSWGIYLEKTDAITITTLARTSIPVSSGERVCGVRMPNCKRRAGALFRTP